VIGRRQTDPIPFTQPLDAYIESFHGRAAFSRARMTSRDAQAFDQALRDLVASVNPEQVEVPILVDIVWGKPLQPNVSTA
jgi:hypothetical protein